MRTDEKLQDQKSLEFLCCVLAPKTAQNIMQPDAPVQTKSCSARRLHGFARISQNYT